LRSSPHRHDARPAPTPCRRIKSFINYRIAATLQLLVFFFIAVFALRPKHYAHFVGRASVAAVPGFPGTPAVEGINESEFKHWEEASFFKVPVLLLMLITLLNDGTLISVGYDNAVPSQRPDKWNLRVVWLVSVVLGIIACLSNVLCLYLALDSWNPSGILYRMGIPPIPYAKVGPLLPG
jgi:H+-transporting ATPase